MIIDKQVGGSRREGIAFILDIVDGWWLFRASSLIGLKIVLRSSSF